MVMQQLTTEDVKWLLKREIDDRVSKYEQLMKTTIPKTSTKTYKTRAMWLMARINQALSIPIGDDQSIDSWRKQQKDLQKVKEYIGYLIEQCQRHNI